MMRWPDNPQNIARAARVAYYTSLREYWRDEDEDKAPIPWYFKGLLDGRSGRSSRQGARWPEYLQGHSDGKGEREDRYGKS